MQAEIRSAICVCQIMSLPLYRSLKHSGALLGSNPMRNRTAQNDRNGQELLSSGLLLFIPGVSANAKKNPFTKRLRFSFVIPLWLSRFFFRSVNVPSILLFVLGIPSTCWYHTLVQLDSLAHTVLLGYWGVPARTLFLFIEC